MSANPLETTFFSTGQPGESSVTPPKSGAPAATFPSGSAPWWIARMRAAMSVRNVRLQRLRDYYLGENSTWQFANEAHRVTFGEAFKDLRGNFAETVVEVVEQRMTVQGISLWDDDKGSEIAWDIWQQNALDARSSEAHLDALSTGIAAVIVGQAEVAPGIPLVTVEDPLTVYVEHDPADERSRLAALKSWVEDDGRRTAILYLPERIEWWRTAEKEETDKPTVWVPVDGKGGGNPLEVVPVVELRNAPRARAEHERLVKDGLLDRYAKVLYDMTTVGDYASYPQRWGTGVTMDEEDTETGTDGSPTGPEPATFKTGPNRLVSAENPDSRFGQFEPSDLLPYIRDLDKILADAAAFTSTPQRLLIPPPSSVPPSGESVRLSDVPLTAKIRRKFTTLGNGWETVIRLAFLARGDAVRARRMDLEADWKDPEIRTESEHMDALSKAQAMGVPQEELWRRMGVSPQKIRRWKAAGIEPVAPTEGAQNDDARASNGTDPDAGTEPATASG